MELDNRVCIGTLRDTFYEETNTQPEDTESFVDYTRSMEGVEIGPLRDGYKVQLPQPKNDIIPSLPCRGMLIAGSNSGKTNQVVTMLTDPRFYKDLFEGGIYWCSPSAKVDPSLDALRRYIATTKQNQETDPTFHETVDVPFLQSRVERAKKFMKKIKNKKLQKKLKKLKL